MDMNRSDSIVNSYFSETLCIMHAKVHTHIHTNSAFSPTQRKYIWFSQSNRLSHASGLLYMLFPLPRTPLSPLIFLSPCSPSTHPQDIHKPCQTNSHFPLRLISWKLSKYLSQSAHPLIATILSITLLFCTLKLPYTYLGYKIYHTDMLLFIHSPIFFPLDCFFFNKLFILKQF